MSKYDYMIEVKVPSGSKRWQKVVSVEMKQVLDDLKDSVEHLGGRIYIRY